MITNEQKKLRLRELMALMKADLKEYEEKYDGKFAEKPHIGLGNRKTKCVNEATLPIITCHSSCMQKCVLTCYVINIMTYPRPNCRRCQARNTVLRRIDAVAYYEYFFAEAERLQLPIRLSDGGDFENVEQVHACIKAAKNHPTVHAIGYTKRIDLLSDMQEAPDNLHIRYSAWEGDEGNTAKARDMGFDVTNVVYDGTGNCPYQKSLAKFMEHKREIARQLRSKGYETKTANKMAEAQTEALIKVHHCRDCAKHGRKKKKKGIDISFNEVKS